MEIEYFVGKCSEHAYTRAVTRVDRQKEQARLYTDGSKNLEEVDGW